MLTAGRLSFFAFALASGATPASAGSPDPELAGLIRAARSYDADLQALGADIEVRRLAIDVADGALWPRLDARLGYTRNQHDATLTVPAGEGTKTVVITPYDQIEATVTLTVPLFDLGRRGRIEATEVRLEADRARLAERGNATDEAVARAWFEGVFARSRSAIATEDLASAEARVARVALRQDAGFASPLERARAEADIERARRAIADARLDEATARLTLARLCGDVAPTFVFAADTASAPPTDELGPWLARVATLPAIAALEAEADALRNEARAAGLDLVPTVDAFVAERVTNAQGFGAPDNLQVGITASFRLDLPTLRRDDELAARVRAAELRAEAARRAATERIAAVFHQIVNRQARIAAARAEAKAEEVALTEAEARAREGKATALDVDDARRALSNARIEIARAEAELALAQVLLTTTAGLDPLQPVAPASP